MESGDASAEITALRETSEELGISPQQVQVVVETSIEILGATVAGERHDIIGMGGQRLIEIMESLLEFRFLSTLVQILKKPDALVLADQVVF